MSEKSSSQTREKIPFKTETRQILNILIHSLYTEREVFLRELISNASDAVTRIQFEQLTNHNVLDPDTQPGIWVTGDKDAKTLSIRDNGIGMDAKELAENLGTIAHSGARAFIEAASAQPGAISDIIGQFGVGFYSVFIVAESIEVTSRTFRPEGEAARWIAMDEDTYSIQPAEKMDRGTTIVIHLKDDALEFADEDRLREIIHKHSDFIPHPIYLGSGTEPVNQQSAIWRRQPSSLKDEDYLNFYRQFTLDHQDPLLKVHLSVDAPVQMFALLYIPASPEKTIFSPRKDEGLKLYARKVLIQEYSKDLLPGYLRFMDGVVDSEDLPLNVARESIQSNRVMAQLKRVISNKVLDALTTLGKDQPEKYAQFWKMYSRYIKEGIATDPEALTPLTPLLRYPSARDPQALVSLADYTNASPSYQEKIYYLLGDDERLLAASPHLEGFKTAGIDVLLMADPLDSFVLLKLDKFEGKLLVNAAQESAPTSASESTPDKPDENTSDDGQSQILQRIKSALGERVTDVRATSRLVESPARLVDSDGAMKPEIQRVYRLLNQTFDAPQKVLEVNIQHPLIQQLAKSSTDDPVANLVIEQLYENALLMDGSSTDPAKMITRIQNLMQAALEHHDPQA